MNAAQLLYESKTISVLLPLQPQENDTREALLLVCGLKQLGKQVSLISGQTSLPTASSLEEKTFVVSLKGLAPKIARVRYEKDQNDLKLYFTLNQGGISPEALSIERQEQPDLILIVGDKPLQDNTVSPSPSLIPTCSFREAKNALCTLLQSKENPQTRILGIILSKLEYIPSHHIFVALFQKEEFFDVQAYTKALPLALLQLQKTFQDNSSFLVLFDSPQGCQGILWSSSLNLRAKFRDMTGGQQKGSWVLLHPTPLSSTQLKHAFLS